MGHLAGRDLAFDGIEEADELLVTVLLSAFADHCAFEHVEAERSTAVAFSEQRRRAVALLIVSERAQTTGLQG